MERYKKEYKTKWQNQYTEEFKLMVCEEYKIGTLLRRQLERKYNIGNTRLTCWLQKYGYSIKKPESIALFSMAQQTKWNTDKEIAKLQKELEDSKLLAESYKKMIEIAEKELKIDIRKKSNTK